MREREQDRDRDMDRKRQRESQVHLIIARLYGTDHPVARLQVVRHIDELIGGQK